MMPSLVICVHGRLQILGDGCDDERFEGGKNEHQGKILTGKPLTTEELGEWLIESISEWTEAEKAQAREALLKDWLKNMPCNAAIQ